MNRILQLINSSDQEMVHLGIKILCSYPLQEVREFFEDYGTSFKKTPLYHDSWRYECFEEFKISIPGRQESHGFQVDGGYYMWQGDKLVLIFCESSTIEFWKKNYKIYFKNGEISEFGRNDKK